MTTEFLQSYQQIKSKHNEAFKIIDHAIRDEEQENPQDALVNYKKGIEIIDEALAISVGLPEDINSVQIEWNEACKIVHKLKRARAEVLQRIGILTEKYRNDDEIESSFEDLGIATSSTECARPRTYSELAQTLRNLQCTETTSNTLELIFSCDNVKLYHIRENGVVTTTLNDSTLRVLRLSEDTDQNVSSTYFMQIIKTSNTIKIISKDDNSPIQQNIASVSEIPSANGYVTDNFDSCDDSSWIYPLIPCVTPCFRTNYSAFIFPDIESSESGNSFGIILPQEGGFDEIFLEILEAILHGVVRQLKVTEKEIQKDIPTEISENIIRGAQFISQTLVKGAEKAGDFISYSTPYLISKIKRAPSDAPPVSNNIQTTVEVAKSVTGVAATCAGYVTKKVAEKTNCLGRFLAPHIQRHGSTLLNKAFGIEESEANEKMHAALTIAASAVEGFGTVYSGLEDSAKILGSNLSSNSVKIIEHKYGTSAGNLAAGTFDTVGNVINLSKNASIIKPKSFVKHTAKGTGKAIISELNSRSTSSDVNYIPASSLYPNLSELEKKVSK